jgi:lipopolysaccharide assembly protein A
MQRNILIVLFFALIVAIFSIQNASTVSISIFTWKYDVSLVIIVLGAIAFGAIVMGVFTSFKQIQIRRELRTVKNERDKLVETNHILEKRITQLTKEEEKIEKEEKEEEEI